jgi:hypothetical protein
MAPPAQPNAGQEQADPDGPATQLRGAVAGTSEAISPRSWSITRVALTAVSASLTAALILIPLLRSTIWPPGSCPAVIIPPTTQTGG